MKLKTQIIFSLAILILANARAADLVWIGGTGFWNAAGNWSPAQIPTAADTAWITNNGTYTLTAPAGSTATAGGVIVGGASGTQTLAIDRATLTINSASAINTNGQLTLLVAQSVVTGPGNLTVNGVLNLSNGTLSGTGIATIGAGGSMAIGSGGITLGRTINNGGMATWAGGNLTLSAGVALNNLAAATFDITADARLSGAATTPINNSGLFRQTAGTISTIVSAPFNNNGMLQVLAASLSLNLGGTHSGTFSNAASATLNLGGGSHSMSASTLVEGAGIVTVNGTATILSAGGTFVAGTTLSTGAGSTTLATGCDVTAATLNVGGGVLNFNTASSVSSLNLTAGTLGGTSPITVSGLLTLNGGSVTNSLLKANGGLLISGNTTLSGTRLVNPGTALWTAGNFTGANGAVVSNLLGATFINTFDGNAASGAGATPIFINAGTFQKTNGTAAAGTTSIDFQFINTGMVEVQTNTLRYSFNQQNAGLTLLDGGNLSAQGQPLQILGGSLVGTGLVTVANVQNVVNASSISPGLPIGELDIAGNYQQTSLGILNIELGGYAPGTEFDLVTMSAGGAGGVATLGGTLNISLANGFSPTNGATFTFLTASSRVGAFATFNYPSNEIGMQVSYDTISAKVTVSNLKPVVLNPIPDTTPITYGGSFNFQFAPDTFSDPDNNLLSYSVAGMPTGLTFNAATRTISGAPTQSGSFPVSVIATDNGTPSLSVTNTFTITINPATLSVTAQPQTKTYGAVDPVLTYNVTGLQFSDTAATVLTGSLTRSNGQSVAGSPYAITQGTLSANSNYVISFSGSECTITPAALSIIADSKTKVYGAADPAFTVSYSGFVNSETPAVLGGTLTFNRAPGQNVGNYSITPGGVSAANYAISFGSGNLSITKASLSITAENKTKAYGTADPVFTATFAGFVNSDTSASLAGALSFNRAPGENVGNYLITPAGLTSGNYLITFNTGTLAINKTALSITADAKTKIYGAADPLFTVSYNGFVNGDTVSALGGSLSFTRAPGENVGSYDITPSGLTSSNYTITLNAGTLSITTASLSVTANAKTKIYGAADPAFTVTYSGFVNGDTSAALGGTLGFTRTPGENVGPYTITPNGLTSANYTIAFNTGTLTITKAALTITADAKTKVYGASDPALTVTYAGFVNSDTPAALGGTLSIGRVAGESVGTYSITASGLTSGNYNITFNTGNFTITRASLSVAADLKTKTYGSIDPTFTATYSGFVNGETPAVLGGALSFVRATGENVGSYLITPSGVTSANYSITFNTGNLTITKAALSVTADSKTKVYGAADPAFTATFAGFVNGETPAVLGGTLAFARISNESAGTYPITPSGLTSANYSITFNTGTLSITRATLSVSADAKTKVYGAVDPALTYAASGFQFSDTAATVLIGALTRATGESVAGGPYTITQGTLSANSNYTISFTGSALTITKAPLSVTADGKTKIYGATDPAFTVTYIGFVNTETPAVLGRTLGFTRASGQNVGTYLITPSGLTSGNYSISFNTGILTITRAALSVSADSKSKIFGIADPVFTASFAGFVNGDTSTSLGGTLAFGRTPGEGIGSYQITPSGLTSSNYTITFIAGTLSIVAPPPSIFPLVATPSTIIISWTAVSNATYRVQFKPTLNATNWTDLLGDVLAVGNTASKTDIKTTTNRFYRIQVMQ